VERQQRGSRRVVTDRAKEGGPAALAMLLEVRRERVHRAGGVEVNLVDPEPSRFLVAAAAVPGNIDPRYRRGLERIPRRAVVVAGLQERAGRRGEVKAPRIAIRRDDGEASRSGRRSTEA